MKTIHLTILGMDCAACASTLERTLRRQKGVERAAVNYTAGTMELTYDDGQRTLEDVVLAVKKAGFRIPVEEADLVLSPGADVEAVMEAHDVQPVESVDQLLEVDAWAREQARRNIR